MSEKSVPLELTIADSLEKLKNTACELKYYSKKKIALSEKPIEKTEEITIEETKMREGQKARSTTDIKDDKSAIPTKDSEDKAIPTKDPVKGTEPAETLEVTKVSKVLKKESPKNINDVKLEIPAEISKDSTETREALTVESTKNVKGDDKSAIPVKDPEESYAKNTKAAETPEVIKVRETLTGESPKDIKDVELKISTETPEVREMRETLKVEPAKDVENNSSPQDSEENYVKDAKPAEDTNKSKKIPVLRKDLLNPWDLGARKIWRPMSAPNLDERPLILTTHLVPSLPVELFEVFAEIIEVITKKPVVLLYETRFGRPVAKDVVDIAILPAADDWSDGVLLPASFVFKHHLNKNNSPKVYADIIVADDRAPHVEDIMDLRGHRCAIPGRRNKVSATALLFNHLHTKGENPAFFGNILDANSQLDVLQMVAGKQAEVGVLEASVIRCHKLTVIGAEFLHILASLGPLPPYRIMINKALVDTLAEKFTTYLLNINQHKEWMDRLSSFDIVGFAENSTDFYNLDDIKSVATSVPYY